MFLRSFSRLRALYLFFFGLDLACILLYFPSSFFRNSYILIHSCTLLYAKPRSQSAFISILSLIFAYPTLTVHPLTSLHFPFQPAPPHLTRCRILFIIPLHLLSAYSSLSAFFFFLICYPRHLKRLMDALSLRRVRVPMKSRPVTPR